MLRLFDERVCLYVQIIRRHIFEKVKNLSLEISKDMFLVVK